jgi:heme oxygenase
MPAFTIDPPADANARCVVYVLSDPRYGTVRYVGKTERTLRERLLEHMSECEISKQRNRKNNWLRKVKRETAGVVARVFTCCASEEEMNRVERQTIAAFRAAGVDLVNSTDGGEGCTGYRHTSETRALLRKQKHTLKHRIQNSRAKGGRAIIDHEGTRFELACDAARHWSISAGTVRFIANGKSCASKGLRFRWEDEEFSIPANKLTRAVSDDRGNQWASIAQAAKALDISQNTVSAAINGADVSYKERRLRYSDGDFVTKVHKDKRPVADDRGNSWPSLRAAAKELGVSPNSVFKAVSGANQTCRGRRLRYLEEDFRTEGNVYRRPVGDDTGAVWDSVSAAARALNVTPGAIRAVLKGKSKTCRGRKFRYL